MNKTTEEVVSMFLGLVIVVVVIGLIFTYFQRRRGEVTVPGISQTLVTPNETLEKVMSEETKYTVKEGDSLWKIALGKYNSGYNWVDIASANKLSDPGKLLVGQELILPKAEKREVMAVAVNKGEVQTKIEVGNYKVMKGDTLWKIAVRAYGDGYQWVQLWKNNTSRLRDPDKLEIGMELVIAKLD